jgi:hypothetical protein
MRRSHHLVLDAAHRHFQVIHCPLSIVHVGDIG